MKNLTSVFVLVLILVLQFNNLLAQNAPCSYPQEINGVAVYVMSEPTEEYEVVGSVNTVGMQTTMALLSENSTQALDIKELATNLVNRALRKMRKGKLQAFDAIITTTGDSGTCIRFEKAQ